MRNLFGLYSARRAMSIMLVLGALVATTLAAAPGITSAAPRLPQGQPGEISKVILGELSGDAPALWTADSGSIRAELGWQGTDAVHHLNLLTSGDGIHWGNKVVLNEMSRFRPGVARFGTSTSDKVVVAWTGTDVNQSLNVLVGNPPASSTKLILSQESSFTAPSVAVLNGAIYLVWAGTDVNHTLNVDKISYASGKLSVLQKTILWGWNSIASPAIVADPNGQRLLMSWTRPNQQLSFGYSSDGAHWTQPPQSPTAEWSGTSPMMFSAIAANVSTNLKRYFTTWQGTDPAHSLNVKYTTSFPEWPRSFEKAVLPEQSLGGPVIGSVGVGGQVLLAWTGVDVAHHLNVATISVAYASACVPSASAQPTIPNVITHGSTSTKRVSLTFDSDGGSAGNATAYLNILRNHGLHATFFLTGAFAKANSTLVKRMVSDGHDVGNHTVDHPDLANPVRTDTFVCNELTGADGTISGIDGRSTRPYFRPPYGSYNEQVQYLAAGLGYRTILWNIDPRDWDPNTTVQDILNRVLNSPNLGPGAIILMHVNSAHESQALDGVITGLQQRGYTIVPLSQLLR